MVTGLNVANCLHCGREWLVGDCIPSVCEECWAAGHRGSPLGGACPVCARLDAEGEAHVAAALSRAGVDIDR
jgi:hypothetical protein